jgi:predicted AAA+ superfamily ATPase
MELRRKLYDRLVAWKTRSGGKTALLIAGARRVGKSYLVSKFAENEYRSYILIDFSKTSKAVIETFENDRLNLDLFFSKLSLIYQTRLFERDSLIIFDEVQLYPQARQFIKHLVADGRYDFIETGSLLSIRYNVKDILIPSEEEEIEMHPLDFEEFLWAKGDHASMDLLKEFFQNRMPLGTAVHRAMMNEFRSYMLVGGMPQAVVEYVGTGNFEKADQVKRGILKLYRNDVAKFARRHKGKIMSVFEEIPSQLTKKEKKFSLASISEAARFREYENAFLWLADAGIINPCYNSSDPNIGLKMNIEHTVLKCYMADTGLLVSHALDEADITANEIYRAILLDRLGINEGMFAENVVAQMLAANGRKLYFYSKHDREDSAGTMEIDFLLPDGKKIAPVEVKSGLYKGHRSLDKFKARFGKRVGTRYILHMKDLKTEDDIVFLPLYMAAFL